MGETGRSSPSPKAETSFYISEPSKRSLSKVILRTGVPENPLQERKGRREARGPLGPWQQRARAYRGVTEDAAPAQVWAPGDAPLPVRQGLSRKPKYQAHIWSSCALPGLGHIIPLQTLFSFPGLSHKRLRRQDKVGSVCVSIPVCVSLCMSGGICASHCDCPIDSQK